MMIYLVFGVFALLSWMVQSSLKTKFKKYSQIPLSNGMTGRDVAMKMLHENGIYDVTVTSATD
jgi:Zn-dependent membrane protease YugP